MSAEGMIVLCELERGYEAKKRAGVGHPPPIRTSMILWAEETSFLGGRENGAVLWMLARSRGQRITELRILNVLFLGPKGGGP